MKNWGVDGDTLMVENRSPRVRNLSIISITGFLGNVFWKVIFLYPRFLEKSFDLKTGYHYNSLFYRSQCFHWFSDLEKSVNGFFIYYFLSQQIVNRD
jgi:hypothetical protein